MTITPTDATTATARTAVDEEPSTQSEHHALGLRVHRSGTGNCHVAAPHPGRRIPSVTEGVVTPLMDGVGAGAMRCLAIDQSYVAGNEIAARRR